VFEFDGGFLSNSRKDEPRAGQLPAFPFANLRPEELAELPSPGIAFGIAIRGSDNMDGCLVATERFDHLQAIVLNDAMITYR
jgi:hypothetical protein